MEAEVRAVLTDAVANVVSELRRPSPAPEVRENLLIAATEMFTAFGDDIFRLKPELPRPAGEQGGGLARRMEPALKVGRTIRPKLLAIHQWSLTAKFLYILGTYSGIRAGGRPLHLGGSMTSCSKAGVDVAKTARRITAVIVTALDGGARARVVRL
jgi:hypothetical protein